MVLIKTNQTCLMTYVCACLFTIFDAAWYLRARINLIMILILSDLIKPMCAKPRKNKKIKIVKVPNLNLKDIQYLRFNRF